jgi:diguanylate cyclase (GGDEF)-like protein
MTVPDAIFPTHACSGPADAVIMQTGEMRETLLEILERRNLHAMFQPILDFGEGEFVGFEGLIRGPAGSLLHTPANLFCAAQQCGLSLEIEMLCRKIVLESFAQQKLPGRLFLNISPAVLAHPSFKNGQTLAHMRKLGIKPERVTIEITENQPIQDIRLMRDALLHYRSMGFKIALDDLGEGFSSLRLWSELHPEFVKIDKHFIKGADTDPLKRQFLRSFQQIAEGSGSLIIAEGIETEAEFKTIRSLGIAHGQGYFIARPESSPQLAPAMNLSLAPSILLAKTPANSRHATAHMLMVHIEPATPDTENNEILARFANDPALDSIPVVRHGKPTGLIGRHAFMERFAQPFQRELLGAKPCTLSAQQRPVLVDKNTPLHEISQYITESQERHFSDDFIITDGEFYLGMGRWLDLLRVITQMQIESARHANPLTLLPGNVPINEHIGQLLNAGVPFHACYCDLDNFKPFNDNYGFYRGDELIQLTGRILRSVCDPILDFIGHIGGDDFILLMQSPDWESRCNAALQTFAEAVASLADDAHRVSGGYAGINREGHEVFHALPTLSIGASPIEPGLFRSYIEVADAASEAKKQAKNKPGNCLFIERRRQLAERKPLPNRSPQDAGRIPAAFQGAA